MKSEKQDNSIDQILKHALFTKQRPDDVLHQKVLHQWKESETMKQKPKYYKAAAAIATCVLIISAVSVGAAPYFHSAGDVVSDMGCESLTELFESDKAISVNQTQAAGEYAFTVLGMAEGEDLLSADLNDADIQSEHFYAVIAISKQDGTELTMDEFDKEKKYFISPLIQGLNPFQYNIITTDGSYSQKEIDGVVYRMIDCDAISYFADRTIYLCVTDSSFYNVDAYDYDEKTGMITRNSDYDGINLLFELPFDGSYADSEKASEYLEKIQEEWENTSSEENTENSEDTDFEDQTTQRSIEIMNERRSVLLEIRESDPANIENAVADMELVDEQTAEKIDGKYSFWKKPDVGEPFERIYECDGYFVNSVDFRLGVDCRSADENTGKEIEYREEVEIVQINEDGTATWKLYYKTSLE